MRMIVTLTGSRSTVSYCFTIPWMIVSSKWNRWMDLFGFVRKSKYSRHSDDLVVENNKCSNIIFHKCSNTINQMRYNTVWLTELANASSFPWHDAWWCLASFTLVSFGGWFPVLRTNYWQTDLPFLVNVGVVDLRLERDLRGFEGILCRENDLDPECPFVIRRVVLKKGVAIKKELHNTIKLACIVWETRQPKVKLY